MAVRHLAGTTTGGAADAIVDWFVLFEAFVVGVGWYVARRVSPTELYLRSVGESGQFTMCFVHVWRVGVGNTVRIEVCDDAVPTHETAEAGTVDSGGVNPFQFWMTASRDFIIVAWQLGAACRFIYAGALLPFALTPADETYYMVATSQLNRASILRYYTGVWDVDINNYFEAYCDNHVLDPDTGTYPLMGLVADTQNRIAGQYQFLSGEIALATGLVQGNTIHTSDLDTTSEWLVLADQVGDMFALWTGGDIPYGWPDGSFAYTSGVALSPAHFLAAFGAFAAGLGWTDLGDPGAPLVAAGDINRQIWSAGEDGASDIWVTWSFDDSLTNYHLYNHDDAIYTHGSIEICGTNAAWYPLPYALCGDLDCIVAALRNNATSGFECFWSGRVIPCAPGVSSPYMNMASGTLLQTAVGAQVLQNHTGAWNAPAFFNHLDPVLRANSSPNLYDGSSYVLWSDFVNIGTTQMIGLTKYVMYVGGAVTQGDSLRLEREDWQALMYNNAGTGVFWAMRRQ